MKNVYLPYSRFLPFLVHIIIAAARSNPQALRDEERQRDLEWDRQRAKSAHVGLLLEREVDRSVKKVNKRLTEENLQLAIDQKAFKRYLDKEVC